MTSRTVHQLRTVLPAAAAALAALSCGSRAPNEPEVQNVQSPVVASVECVIDHLHGNFTAWFTYANPGSTITIPIGNSNKFLPPPADRGQPVTFPHAVAQTYPASTLHVDFTAAEPISWHLGSSTAEATATSPRCPDTTPPSWPAGSQLTLVDQGTSVALHWTAAIDDAAVSAYRVYRNGALVLTLPEATYGATVSGLDPARDYRFQIQAGDPAGNWSTNGPTALRDTTPPVITVSGVSDGEVTRADSVTPVFSAADDFLRSVSATLDAAPFSSGAPVTAEGAHRLIVTAADDGGNGASATVNFTIDRTAPVIDLAGATDGEWRNSPATLTYAVRDLTATTVTALLDGVPFATGTVVSGEGFHTATVSAVDAAGNAASRSLSFHLDRTPPAVAILQPSRSAVLGSGAVAALVAAADDGLLASVTANGTPLLQRPDGTWAGTVSLPEGPGSVVAIAVDAAGNSATATVGVVIDTTPPALTVAAPAENAKIGALSIAVRGSVQDATAVMLTVAGAVTPIAADGSFLATVTLVPGANAVEVRAVDAALNSTSVVRHVRANVTPPALAIASPSDGLVTSAASVTISGTASPADSADAVTVTVEGVPAVVSGGSFSAMASLSAGTNAVHVVATDGYGLQTAAQVSVIRDVTPPQITISGVTDGQSSNAASLSPAFTATDEHLASVTALLDGQPFTSGTPVVAEGAHLLSVTALDQAQNRATAQARFVLDRTPPVILVAGAVDGEYRATPARLTWSVTDANPGSVRALLDGAPVESGVVVAAEGPHQLVVDALDLAGNASRAQVSFVIDDVPPAIAIVAPADGSYTSSPSVAVVAQVAEEVGLSSVTAGGVTMTAAGAGRYSASLALVEGPNPIEVVAIDFAGNVSRASVTVVLDRQAPSLDVAVPAEGAKIAALATDVAGTVHDASPVDLSVAGQATPADALGHFSTRVVLTAGANLIEVTATDAAGNRTIVDRHVRANATPPSLSVDAPADGLVTAATSVTVHATAAPADASDAVAVTVEGVKMDLQPDGSFSAVAQLTAGRNLLHVTAMDGYGLSTTQSIAVAQDAVAPRIAVDGVADGLLTSAAAVVPVFTVTDDNPGTVTATLDGAPFASGTPVTLEGPHLLAVSATDAAGNQASAAVRFTIDRTAPVVSISGVPDGARAGQPVALAFTVQDANLLSARATVDGVIVPLAGFVVSAEGAHVARLEAVDGAGNASAAQLAFTIDLTAPAVSISAPADGSYASSSTVTVVAQVAEEGPLASVTAAGQPMALASDGTWQSQVAIGDGANIIEVLATDVAGNVGRAVTHVLRDTTPPALTVASPTEGARIAALGATVSGTATDASPVTVTVRGVPVSVGANGAFSSPVSLSAGANAIDVTATDRAGNATTVTRNVRANVTPPAVSITDPADGTTTTSDTVVIQGTATAADSSDSVSVIVAGSAAAVTAGGSFSATVPLVAGPNSIEAIATDGYGLIARAAITVTRNAASDAGSSGSDAGTGGPDAGAGPLSIAFDSPADGSVLGTQSIQLSGHVGGGVPPISVTIDGAPAAVSGSSFSAILSPAEGDFQSTAVATDAAGHTATAQVGFHVDRTPPTLAITRPASSPAIVNETPYLLQGTASDPHLASVTVQGTPVSVTGGSFSAQVPLANGETDIVVVAVDSAGNQATVTQHFSVVGLPPSITILEPPQGSEAAASIVTVQVQVDGSHRISQVFIGDGAADALAPGIYQARVTLSLGDNSIPIRARDVFGLSGTATLLVHYQDPATVPLTLMGVEPQAGGTNVLPDSAVSITFNKPFDPSTIPGHFGLLIDGTAVAGGYAYSPSNQTASFIPKDALPDGARVTVQVSGVAAAVGPAMQGAFTSDFTVRPALAKVTGGVLDQAHNPVPGVVVSIEGQNVSMATGADGNFILYAAQTGRAVIRAEGGRMPDGTSFQTLRRTTFIETQGETALRPFTVLPTEPFSAQRVDGSAPMHVTFNGRYPGLALDAGAGGIAFPDGSASGTLTATRIPIYASPPSMGRRPMSGLWQLGPAGARFATPLTITMPNLINEKPGRGVLVYGWDAQNNQLGPVGLGQVSGDGLTVSTVQPVTALSLEFFGFATLTPQEQDLFATGVRPAAAPTTLALRLPSTPALLEAPTPQRRGLLRGAPSSSALDFSTGTLADWFIWPDISPTLTFSQGRVQMLPVARPTLNVSTPASADLGQKTLIDVPYLLPVSFEAIAPPPPQGSTTPSQAIASLQAVLRGTPVAPPNGEQWSAAGASGQASLSVHVPLQPGTTRIEMTATGNDVLGISSATQVVNALVAVPDPADFPDAGADKYELTLSADADAGTADALENGAAVFPGIPVWVGGEDGDAITNETGLYSKDFLYWGDFGVDLSYRNIAQFPLPPHAVQDSPGHFRLEPGKYFPWSAPYAVSPWGGANRADIIVDARALTGKLLFLQRDGTPLPPACDDGSPTLFDPDGTVTQISAPDVGTTEIHIFREDDLEHPISNVAFAAPTSQPGGCTASSHGAYERLRVGPTDILQRQVITIRCRDMYAAGDVDNDFYKAECTGVAAFRKNQLRLQTGDRLVAFAINHATGYAGMSTVLVPPVAQVPQGCSGSVKTFALATGQIVKLSECVVTSLEIPIDIKLYPPEVDVRVSRRAPDEGVDHSPKDTLVRYGGSGTTRDDFLRVATHWRVRRKAAPATPDGGGVADAGLDCGDVVLPDGGLLHGARADGGFCGMTRIRDNDADAGPELEVYCSELPPGADRSTCLSDDTTLVDVPPGVPPIAGQLWTQTGSAAGEPFPIRFDVQPGAHTQIVNPAVPFVDATGAKVITGNLTKAHYFVHLVGKPVQPQNPPAPDFTEENPGEGIPKKAIALKNVYTSLDGDGRARLRFDRAREHEFSVIEIGSHGVTAQTGGGDDRDLLAAGANAAANEGDTAYQFLMTLVEPNDITRAPRPGVYELRLGDDVAGTVCQLTVQDWGVSKSLSGTCGGESLMDVVGASDILYIELYLSGNADNVLYRFNFNGLSKREDQLTVGMKTTAAKELASESSGTREPRRPVMDPALAEFFVQPSEVKHGNVKICLTKLCDDPDGVLKVVRFDYDAATATYTLTDTAQGRPDTQKIAVTKHEGFGVEDAQFFSIPLPSDVVKGTGLFDGAVYVRYEPTDPPLKPFSRPLGEPVKTPQSQAARPPGHQLVGGVDLADGHLALSYEDLAVPEGGSVMRFTRTYNNQNNTVHALGFGWSHNFEGVVLEEDAGRYSVILDGQAYDFPTCEVARNTSQYPITVGQCKTDKDHGGQLQVALSNDGLQWQFRFTREGDRAVYTFTQDAQRNVRQKRNEGGRRWLLTSIDDGMGILQVHYLPQSDLVDFAQRDGGKLKIKFVYTEVDKLPDGSDWPNQIEGRVKRLARAEGLKLISKVEIHRASDDSLVDSARYDQDYDPSSASAAQVRVGNLTSVTRETESPTWRWTYRYKTVNPASGASVWIERNEVEQAEFEVGGTVQKHFAWAREGGVAPYEHVDAREVVDRIYQPGLSGQPIKLTFAVGNQRGVDLPNWQNAYDHWDVQLNDFGNVSKATNSAAGTASSQWFSDSDTGIVRPSNAASAGGLAFSMGYASDSDPDPLALASRTLTSAPAGAVSSSHVGQTLQSFGDYDSRWAKPKTVGALAAGGGQRTVKQQIDSTGQPSSLQISDANGAFTVFTLSHGPDGAPGSGTQADGTSIAYSSPNDFGLPQTITVSAPPGGGGGLGSSQTTLEYDAFGRVRHKHVSGTGADETFDYDGLGRMTSHAIAGDTAQAWTYTYEQTGPSQLLVTEKLNGNVVNTKRYDDGLVALETWAWGTGQTAQQVNTYVGGKLTQTVRDTGSGTVTRAFVYDGAGRLKQSTADGLLEMKYELDADGRVKTRTDAQGRVTTISYDDLGRATRWDYGNGDVVTIERDPNTGQETKRTEGTHTVIKSRDAIGRLTAVTSASNPASYNVTYTGTDGAGRFDSLHDDGLDETYQYADALGRMTQRVRTVGSSTLTETWDYSATASGSKIVAHHQLTNGTPASHDVTTTFDAAGRPVRIEDVIDGQAAVNEFHYDARGNVISETRAKGSDREQTTTFSYDDAGRLTKIATPGTTTTYVVDALGRILEQDGPRVGEVHKYEYDSLDRLKKHTISALGNVPASEWKYTYDAGGSTTTTDPANATTTRVTNGRGLLVSETVAGGGGSLATTYGYDGQWVKARTTTEGSWQLSFARTYDDRGRTLTETESWSGSGQSYNYGTTNDWSSPLAPTVTSNWGGGSRTVALTLDGLGNVVSRVSGGVTEVAAWDAMGRQVSSQIGDRLATNYEYEASGRLKRITRGTETGEYSYYADGLPSAYDDPAGRHQGWAYDLDGRVTSLAAGAFTTSYLYEDGGDRPTTVQMPDGVLWHYTFGPRGEVMTASMPDSLGDFAYHYNADGTVSSIDKPGQTSWQTFAYDYLKRPKVRTRGSEMTWSTDWTDGKAKTQDALGNVVDQVFDGRGRVAHAAYQAGSDTVAGLAESTVTWTDLDQVAAVSESQAFGSATATFGFDARGRVQSVSRSEPDSDTQITYGWTAYDTLESIIAPGGSVTYGYDSFGRVQTITNGAGGTPTTVQWEPGGANLRMLSSGAFNEVRCYDAQQDWVRTIVSGDNVDANCNGSNAWQRYEYDYDQRGNRKSQTFTRAGTSPEVTTYGYDSADRLTGVRYADGSASGYALSPTGSRVGEAWAPQYPSSGQLNYDSIRAVSAPPTGTQPWQRTYVLESDERLREMRDGSNNLLATFATDKAGRVHAIGDVGGLQRTLQWDAAARLVSAHVVDASGNAVDLSYRYDASGLRTLAQSSSHRQQFIWGLGGLVESDDSLGGQQLYENVGSTVSAINGEHLIHDGLDSVVGRVSGATQVASRAYDAFGAIVSGGAAPGEPTAAYAGQHWDAELGLSYAQQRWYSPQLGRFLSDDPIAGSLADPVTQNPYLYANSNPLRYRDPDGRIANAVAAGVGAVVGAIGGCAVGYFSTDGDMYVIGPDGREGTASKWKACAKGAVIGAGVGALAGLTFGASLAATGALGIGGEVATGTAAGTTFFGAATTTGSIAIASTVSGAVAGGTGTFLNAVSNGASVSDALSLSSIGALGGALGGLGGAGAGSLVGNFTGNVLSEFAGQATARLGANVAGGIAAGMTADATTQGVMMLAGVQTEGFSWKQMVGAGLLGGFGGAVFHFAEAASPRVASPPEEGAGEPQVCTGETCEAGSFNCFIAGTPVLTRAGELPIERVQAGDEVLARDDEGQLSWRKVTATFVTPDQTIGTISTLSSDGTRDHLGATPGHLFWVEQLGWTPAQDLQEGDQLYTPHSGWLRVTSSTWIQERATVYNLTVEGAHTYFVGDGAALVHNVGRCGGDGPENNGARKLGSRALPDTERPWESYQRHVTGKSNEELWSMNGKTVGVDARNARYTVEAKWAGKNEAAYKSSPYHPEHEYYDESKIISQARRLLELDAAIKGSKGVRYAISNDAARAHFQQLFQENFPQEIASGRLTVWHVPGNGM